MFYPLPKKKEKESEKERKTKISQLSHFLTAIKCAEFVVNVPLLY